MGNYVFTLEPTFTQGLIFGQLSILVLLALILKYLFLDSPGFPTFSYQPRQSDAKRSHSVPFHESQEAGSESQWSAESTEWFNTLLQGVRSISFPLLLNTKLP